jgi:hypothetical protein
VHILRIHCRFVFGDSFGEDDFHWVRIIRNYLPFSKSIPYPKSGALTVLVVLLLGSLLSLLLTCRSYKQRYEHLAAAVEEADEKSPLLFSSRLAAVRRRNAGPAAAEEQMSG